MCSAASSRTHSGSVSRGRFKARMAFRRAALEDDDPGRQTGVDLTAGAAGQVLDMFKQNLPEANMHRQEPAE